MGTLLSSLLKYNKDRKYPFHMPGHKRNVAGLSSQFNPYEADISEIKGFDNLHDATGILKACMEEAAAVYGSGETHYLVNGSTGGILAAISACFREGDKILFARNSHKSAYHAVLINKLNPVYLVPETDEDGIQLSVEPDKVKDILRQQTDVAGVYITSPTYDGVASDIAAIAELAHSAGIPLIVDEAHGAHFVLYDGFPASAVSCGADIVINSVHKTLPALTQTALIHINGTLVDRERLRRYLSIYQSSSPSYVLMAGIDQCINYIKIKGTDEAEKLLAERKALSEYIKTLSCIEEFDSGKMGVYSYDEGKLLIKDTTGKISGTEISDYLLDKHGLQCEMAAGRYVTLILTIMDTKEGISKLKTALRDVDKHISELQSKPCSIKIQKADLPKRAISMHEAFNREYITCSLRNVSGKISYDSIIPYPPGIPLIIPGERFDDDTTALILSYLEQGITVEGIHDNNMVRYVK